MQNLYFIAIVPPVKECNEITQFKNDFALRFGSSAVLKVIPHITLKAPFPLPVSAHEKLKQWFQQLSVSRGPFQIELKNFEAFHNKNSPVVFVNPMASMPLYNLQKEIIGAFRKAFPTISITDPEIEFRPHITIAYRDLRPSAFVEAWKEYSVKKYESLFEVNSFHLLQHDRKKWSIIDTYSL